MLTYIRNNIYYIHHIQYNIYIVFYTISYRRKLQGSIVRYRWHRLLDEIYFIYIYIIYKFTISPNSYFLSLQWRNISIYIYITHTKNLSFIPDYKINYHIFFKISSLTIFF